MPIFLAILTAAALLASLAPAPGHLWAIGLGLCSALWAREVTFSPSNAYSTKVRGVTTTLWWLATVATLVGLFRTGAIVYVGSKLSELL